MAHLLKIEIKKFRLLRNIFIAVIAIVLCILFITVSLVDSMTDPKQTKDTFESTFLVIGLLVSFIFLVYSSVITASLVINEYSQRTITILFSYPLNKKSLIAAKMVIISIFTAAAILLGYICCCGYIIGMDTAFDMLEGSFQMAYLSEWIPMIIVSTIVCSILSWWPFVIGMIKKSIPATIVTSLVVMIIRQVIITKNPTNQENIWQIGLTLGLTAVAVFIIFQKKVSDISS
jgi:ABC-type transport system involved in multi-copper enzyme maturation permease subunit